MTAVVELNHQGVKAVRSRHPWVYRDHVARGQSEPGALVRVVDVRRHPIGVAAWSAASSKIALRFVHFGPADPPDRDELRRRFDAACERRRPLLAVTDAMRLISSEADGFPGLIVDRYRSLAVVQALTAFADRLLPDVVDWLGDQGVEVVVARHDSAMRDLEGLPRGVEVLRGAVDQPFEIQEHGLTFLVDPIEGQKTGHFLDQRANRVAVAAMVGEGERVLDAFSYTGGFGLHAARRAGEVWCYDDSEKAVERAQENARRNRLDNVTCQRANAFKLLRDLVKRGERFDMVILDPPAFARSRRELGNALRGYREINRMACRLVREGGLVVSASCSYQVQEPLFEDMLRRAAADAGRDALVEFRGSQDVDHPVLLSLPQSRYLKCYVLRVGVDGGAADPGPDDSSPDDSSLDDGSTD